MFQKGIYLIYNYFGEINSFPGNQNFSNSWVTVDAIKKLSSFVSVFI